MKKITALAMCVLLMFTVAACNRSLDKVDPNDEVILSVVMITDKNGSGDNGINDLCWKGLQRAELDYAINIEKIETTTEGYAKSIEEAVAIDPDLIICPSADMAPVLEAVHGEYEDQIFVLFDAGIEEAFNVTSVYFNPEQSAYLAGIVAALSTKENVVGFIGPKETETVDRYLYGFTAGVTTANNQVYISTNYVDKTDSAREAKQTAVAQYKLGADVIFHIVGKAGDGVVDAAEERNFKVISLDPKEMARFPESVLCTVEKNGDTVCYDIVKKVIEGSFDGSAMNYGIKEEGFYIADSTGAFSEEILSKVEQTTQAIKNGSLVVPYDNVSYQTYINGGVPLPLPEGVEVNNNPEMDVQ